jgi:thiamine-phosphate pyrophosphorylase
MRARLDLSLYHVTDARLSGSRGLVETVLAAVRGGATLIQLRDPEAKAGALIELGRALLAALEPTGVPLIVNDRPDVALALGAAGVHLGQGDLAPAIARRILGPHAVIGLSIDHPDQLARVPWDEVDHLGVGPVYARGAKADAAEPMGLEGLAACVRRSRVPVVAIGGIAPGLAAACVHAGAEGVAVVNSIAGAADPEARARELSREVRRTLEARAWRARGPS